MGTDPQTLAESLVEPLVKPLGLLKRFAIFFVDPSGHPELYADTDLLSEARRFEALGYLVTETA